MILGTLVLVVALVLLTLMVVPESFGYLRVLLSRLVSR